MHVADIRGWGHLTGIGACALPEKEAIAIQEANSRLIAAAPDLLAALKLAESVYRKNVVVQGEPSSILDAMQAAIARAEA